MPTLTQQAAEALVDEQAQAARAAAVAELIAESERQAAAERAEAEAAEQRRRELAELERLRKARMKVDAEGDVVLTALVDWIGRSRLAADAHAVAARRCDLYYEGLQWRRREEAAVLYALHDQSSGLRAVIGHCSEHRLSDAL